MRDCGETLFRNRLMEKVAESGEILPTGQKIVLLVPNRCPVAPAATLPPVVLLKISQLVTQIVEVAEKAVTPVALLVTTQLATLSAAELSATSPTLVWWVMESEFTHQHRLSADGFSVPQGLSLI